MVDVHGSATRLGRIRNVLEVDPRPSAIAFFIRSVSRRGSLWSMQRLGAYQRVSRELSGVIGHCWPSKMIEFTSLAGEPNLYPIYAGEFTGLTATRLMSVSGERATNELRSAFDPQIVIHQGQEPIPRGWTERAIQLDGLVMQVGFASASAQDAFDEDLARHVAHIQEHQALDSILIEARDLMTWDGFYRLESSNTADWLWTGASREARFVVPMLKSRRIRVTLFLFAAHTPLDQGLFAMTCNGVDADVRVMPEYSKIEADVDVSPERGGQLFVVLRHAELKLTHDGSRELGIAVHRVRVECI